MGQQHSIQEYKNFSDLQVQQYIQNVFNNTHQRLSIHDVSMTISLVLQHLKSKIPFEKIPSGLVMSIHMVKILYHNRFVSTINKLIILLIQKLQELDGRNLLLVKRHQWGILSQLVKLILIFTDQKLIQTVQIYTIRLSQLDQNFKKVIQDLQESKGSFNAIDKRILEKLPLNVAESLYTVLTSSLLKLIQQRINPISRSSQTMLIMQHVEQSLFMLFNKLVLNPHHYRLFIDKARNTIALKDFMTIGQYFLGSSCNLSLPSVYESAVLLLLCVIQKNQKNLKIIEKDILALPSFIFPNLPVVNKKSVFDCIGMICLFSLVYTKQGTNFYQRFSFNRLLTLRLLNVIVRQIKVTNGQMTEYIEELSLQTKIGMAERSFVTEVVKNYVRLIDQKIIYNKQKEQQRKKTSTVTKTINTITTFSNKVISRIKRLPRQRPAEEVFTTISRYTLESNTSKILLHYLQSGAQPYSIKYKGKRYTIPYIDVVDQIEKDDKQLQKQLKPLYEKFVYQFILYKKVMYQHIDKYVWTQILPKIIEGRGLQGEEISQTQMSQRSQNNQSRINVVGYAPVISLKLTQSQVKNELSSRSISKNKSLTKNSRFQTEQQSIYNQTTQQSKHEHINPQKNIKQWQNAQSKRKLSSIENETPKNQIKKSEEQKYNAQNSQCLINLPQVNKKNKHANTGEFVIEEMQ